jgi:hypothetical protein
MATGQSLLNLMELLVRELQLQTGESDVTRGLIALNAAQDYFETRAALYPRIFGSTTGTVTTTANGETTTFPTGVLRLDRLQLLGSDSLPVWDLAPLQDAGEHAYANFWPVNILSTSAPGRPRAYDTDGGLIYWDPIPDSTHTVRWYGFKSADDITASGTFAYPDAVMLPLATFACQLFKLGLDDSSQELAQVAQSVFDPVLDTLSSFRREGPRRLSYRYHHDT